MCHCQPLEMKEGKGGGAVGDPSTGDSARGCKGRGRTLGACGGVEEVSLLNLSLPTHGAPDLGLHLEQCLRFCRGRSQMLERCTRCWSRALDWWV
jgi:hypothetical protein